MVSTEVVVEFVVIVEEFFAEVAPGMWKYFCASVVRSVSMLYMCPQCFQMVYPLFADEYSPSFEAYFAECFLMSTL